LNRELATRITTLFGWGVALVGYTLAGLQFAFPLALLSGISEFVPTLGPLLSFVIALLFASMQGAGPVIGVLIVYLVIHILESYM
jgi:predicted PurR-regulated permease PerM